MAPFHPATAGLAVEIVTFLGIGLAFGAVLEMSGFGDSRKLAAQFYLREMTVLKVMFTAIITAAVLIHLASSLELLDLRRVWINPTYLWPGIAGGLIMGVGFIVGGFCPGTSLVAAATLKLDGIAFVLGGLCGVAAFGETVHFFDSWWQSSDFGRFTLADWLRLPTGVTVILLVLMALGMFVAAEAAERVYGGRAALGEGSAPPVSPRRRRLLRPASLGAGLLLLLAAVTSLLGQPSARDRWRWIAARGEQELRERKIFVEPAEVVALRQDLTLAVRIYEVRSESDFNQFHLAGSRRIDPPAVEDPAFLREFLAASDQEIRFLASNDEAAAVEAWKALQAQGAVNVYVIEGGINRWLDAFPPQPRLAERWTPKGVAESDRFAWNFTRSVGERIPSAHPEVLRRDPALGLETADPTLAAGAAWFDGRQVPPPPATRKVVLQRKVVAKGGCG